MKKLLVALFALLATHAIAQNAGTVANHAFALGKGPGVVGYTSLLCASGRIPMGQTSADPQCVAVSGDGAISAAGVLTLTTVNANVGSFGSATQSASIAVNGKGLITAASALTLTPAIANVTGLGSGVAAALTLNVGSAGAPVVFNGAGGTPSAITLTNATGLPTTALTGTLQAAQVRTRPTTQAFTSGSGTYTTPANVLWIEVLLQGPGGGGAGSGTTTTGGAGGTGTGTCWNTTGAACTSPVYAAGAGGGAAGASSPAGGTPGAVTGSTACTTGVNGSSGFSAPATSATSSGGGNGAPTAFGGGGPGGIGGGGAGGNSTVIGTGGGGAGTGGGGVNPGGGGGAGASCYAIINGPAATYTYAVGPGGGAGTAGTSGAAGGTGSAGYIRVIEHYGS